MIQPDQIRQKAENLFPVFLRAWLAGEEFFPRTVPADKTLDDSLAAASAAVRSLQAGSKVVLGFGYSIEWENRNSRKYGKNRFPKRVYFESAGDLLRYIGKQKLFAVFTAAVTEVRTRYPALDRWIRSNRQMLIDAAGDLTGLLEVVDYLSANPRPGVFARQLPLSVDTKFVERNQRILRAWLDLTLPPESIRSDEEHFARRFGLRYAEPHLLVRFLDPELRQASNVPWSECSIPLHTLASGDFQPSDVIVVENRVNLLALPHLRATVAIGGLGYGVTDLRYLTWLTRPRLWYWGDIDIDGFVILSKLRSFFPEARSIFMDDACLMDWEKQIGTFGNGRSVDPPQNLTDAERAAFDRCLEHNLRVEQERLPQSIVERRLLELLPIATRIA